MMEPTTMTPPRWPPGLLPPGLAGGVDSEHLAQAAELLILRNFAAVSLTAQAKMTRPAERHPDAERIQTFEMGLHRLGRTLADMSLCFDRLRRRDNRATAPLPAPRLLEIERDLETLLGGVIEIHDTRGRKPKPADPGDDPKAEFERRISGYFEAQEERRIARHKAACDGWSRRMAQLGEAPTAMAATPDEAASGTSPVAPSSSADAPGHRGADGAAAAARGDAEAHSGAGTAGAPWTETSPIESDRPRPRPPKIEVRMARPATPGAALAPEVGPRPLAGPRIRQIDPVDPRIPWRRDR